MLSVIMILFVIFILLVYPQAFLLMFGGAVLVSVVAVIISFFTSRH